MGDYFNTNCHYISTPSGLNASLEAMLLFRVSKFCCCLIWNNGFHCVLFCFSIPPRLDKQVARCQGLFMQHQCQYTPTRLDKQVAGVGDYICNTNATTYTTPTRFDKQVASVGDYKHQCHYISTPTRLDKQVAGVGDYKHQIRAGKRTLCGLN